MVEIDVLRKLDRPELLDFFIPSIKWSDQDAYNDQHVLEALAEDGIRLRGKIFDSGKAGEPHIVFFPGEFDTPETIMDLASGFGRLGLTLIAMDYRGTGNSEGSVSISSLLEDGSRFLKRVIEWKSANERPGPVVPMGRSLGTAVALHAACNFQDNLLALIMESAFDRTSDFLNALGFEDLAGEIEAGIDPFSNREKMGRFKPPVMFLHSHIDKFVNLNQVEWMVAASRSKATQFQIIPSDGREGLCRTGGTIYFSNIKDYLFLRMGRRPKYIPLRKRKKGGPKPIFPE